MAEDPPENDLEEVNFSHENASDSLIPEDVRTYDRFSKIDRASYDRVNKFLRDRTYITAREWAIARLCSDFRTATGIEMTKIGTHLPELVPFMTKPYSPQAVNQARHAFEAKIKKLDKVSHEQIANAFQREDLIIYTNPEAFKDFLFKQNFDNKALLLMSSGNYGGLDFDAVKGLID